MTVRPITDEQIELLVSLTLLACPKPMSRVQLAELLGLSVDVVRVALAKLCAKGEATSVAGSYGARFPTPMECVQSAVPLVEAIAPIWRPGYSGLQTLAAAALVSIAGGVTYDRFVSQAAFLFSFAAESHTLAVERARVHSAMQARLVGLADFLPKEPQS